VKIGTSVIILPYRNPIVVAKMLATADQLSAGRLIFGAAIGWMEAAATAPDPIWVGGNSGRARRRVAEFGDGWHATAMPLDELKAGIVEAHNKWARRGRMGEPVFSLRIPCSIEGVS
jgi:alkanesulfonate monooxygenase SsuD/methylene tetrahydromethanopterin reductase-like flavin-dependent oxidoreductase (luciferase family)